MKILQICAAYKPAYVYGGPTISVSRLSEELVKSGHQIEVFTTTANGASELPVQPGELKIVDNVKVTYFKRLSGDHTHYSPDLLAALRRRINDFEIVHIHAWWNLVSLLTCKMALKREIPVVISPRGTLSNYSFNNSNSLAKKMIHGLIGKQLLSKSYLHVTSDRELRATGMIIKPRGVFNIPNFINLPEKLNEITPRKDSPLRMIFFSRIDKKKGLELLFDALKNISIDYRLTIAGSGDMSYITGLKVMAMNNGISSNIEWIGFKTDDKFDILLQHDLFVLTSYDENFGNAVVESLSTGTAVLVSDQVGLSQYVEHNQLGWVCNQNANSIRDQIIKAFNDRDKLLLIRNTAPTIIHRDFSSKALVDFYIGAYKKILKND